jgi:hypothetical protein
VPITVWRTAGGDATTTVPTRLAYRLVSAYSRPGEAVIDLTDGHALAAACHRGARHHHKAWFTDAASLIIGPATPQPATRPTAEDGADVGGGGPDDAPPPDRAAWYGDDLTDPALPPAGPPVDLPAGTGVAAATSLVVACWPLDAAAQRVRLAWLLTACARLLRPGGCLVLVAGTPAGTSAAPEDFRPLVAAASAAGLGYLQHIVAVAADTGADRFTYFATDEEPLSLAAADGRRWAVGHLRVHADCFVFTQTHDQAPPAGRRGGDARG